ncbi:hypothetical protein HQ447_14850 [bacterium]|nr:hypothetical protein [bacterium]
MKHSFPCVALAALVIFAAVLPKTSGQTTSSLVLTDSSGGGSGASIDGMELRGSGLYWWKFGYAGGEIGSYAPSVGIKGLISRYALNLDRSGPFYMVQAGTTYPTGAERDGAYAYFTANRGGAQVGLFRQLLSSAVNSPPERLAGIVTPEISTGAIGRFGSDLFFAPTYAGGYTAIWRVSFDAAGNFTGAGVTAEGFLNGYAVRKIQFLNATINGITGTYGVCLQADTSLWRFGPLESSSLQPMAYLGAGVGDIGVRRDDGGNAFNGLHDKIYATTSPISGGPIGKLVTINPANGAVTEIYADPGGQKFLAFGFDANFLFLSRTNSPTGEILRKFVPYLSYLTNPVPGQPTGWVTIETVNGTNLRSDGRLLYFTRGNDIRRVGTAVPGISVDVHAFGIEAVQISQDYNNSWPLVAGKPVLVRGYARMAALANAGGSTRQPAATLGVIRNNIGLGNFHPDNSPLIDAEPAASLAIYRGSIARSYNFVIPAELVQSGSMQFTLNVNNPRGMVETGVANPYGNNSISTPVMQVLASGAPSIVCVPLATTDGTYTLDTSPGDFWAQIARARTLLPVSDIRVLTSAAVLKRWTVQYDPPKSGFTRFGFPGDQDEALTRLGAVQGEVSGHNVGMVHPAVSGFNGLGNTSGAKNLLARMEPGTASPGNGWDSSRGGRTLAHEMAHNYGRQHVNFTSGSEAPLGPDMSYPGNPANISGVAGAGNNNLATSVFGWDPVSGQCVDGAVIPDLLSYGASRWLSRYTFNALLAAVPAAALIAPSANGAAAFAVGDVFLISGMVEIAEALASLDPVQSVPDGTYDSGVVAASLAAAALPPGHDYRVRQLDETGAVLAESVLVLGPTGDGWREKTGFRQFLSAEPGAVKLQIVKNGAVLAQVDGAGAAPVVAVDAPVLDAGGQVLRGSWMATDADGDPLFSTVHFSADGGVTWKAVEQQSIQSSVAVDVRTLPGGANCQLRVIVTDGFNTSIAASEGFSLDTHAPEITLIGVQPGQKLAYGSRVSITAFAMDAEEGSLPGGGISWVLSGPQPAVKNGDTLYLENLPPGNYLAVASVTDAGGAPASKELAFEVLPIPSPSAPRQA